MAIGFMSRDQISFTPFQVKAIQKLNFLSRTNVQSLLVLVCHFRDIGLTVFVPVCLIQLLTSVVVDMECLQKTSI